MFIPTIGCRTSACLDIVPVHKDMYSYLFGPTASMESVRPWAVSMVMPALAEQKLTASRGLPPFYSAASMFESSTWMVNTWDQRFL